MISKITLFALIILGIARAADMYGAGQGLARMGPHRGAGSPGRLRQQDDPQRVLVVATAAATGGADGRIGRRLRRPVR